MERGRQVSTKRGTDLMIHYLLNNSDRIAVMVLVFCMVVWVISDMIRANARISARNRCDRMKKIILSICGWIERKCGEQSRAGLIIGYNHKGFDMLFLAARGINTAVTAEMYDVMLEYSYIAGEWSDEYGCFKWKSLKECAKHYGYTNYKQHDALEDARATLYCYYAIKRDKEGRRNAEKRKRGIKVGC